MNISVIIPAYNAASTIARAIDSVIRQQNIFFEIIVVDDGSTDGTGDIILSHYKSRVTLLRQENCGPAAARNYGIYTAKGEYVAFLDADDEWLPGKLQLQVEALEAQPTAGMCFTDMEHWEADELCLSSYLHSKMYKFASGNNVYEKLLNQCFIFTPTVVVRKTVLEEVGCFDDTMKIAEDYDLWLRIAELYPVIFLDMSLLRRYRHGCNITSNTKLYLDSHIKIMDRLLKKHQKHEQYRNIIKRRLAKFHYELAYFYREGDNPMIARTHYSQASRLDLRVVYFIGLISTFFPRNFVKCVRKIRRA